MKYSLFLTILLLCATISMLLYRQHHRGDIQHTGSCINIPALPDYLSSNRPQDAIAAINNARHREHLQPLRLPTHFYQLSPVQQQFILVNLERSDRHLPPLRLDALLSHLAQAYSQQMHDHNFFSHTSPLTGSFSERINSNPLIANHYQLAAENLAGNPVAGIGPLYEYLYDDATEQCSHRANILDPHLQLIGIGVVMGSQYGSISAQEFLSSAPWNPYKGNIQK